MNLCVKLILFYDFLYFSVQPQLEKRFNTAFNTGSVELISKRSVHFVSINSMALENDGCFLCYNAEIKLRQIASKYMHINCDTI